MLKNNVQCASSGNRFSCLWSLFPAEGKAHQLITRTKTFHIQSSLTLFPAEKKTIIFSKCWKTTHINAKVKLSTLWTPCCLIKDYLFQWEAKFVSVDCWQSLCVSVAAANACTRLQLTVSTVRCKLVNFNLSFQPSHSAHEG